MAIHGIQELSDDTLKKLLKEFWECLVQQLNERYRGTNRGDCILFLTQTVEYDFSIESPHLVHLSPWHSVTVSHMEQWLKPMEVRQLLEQWYGEPSKDVKSELIQKDLPNDDLGDPEDVLRRICKTFDLDDEIAELESYWEIAS